jgi:ACS family tartrate transporter-like MFS transporter
MINSLGNLGGFAGPYLVGWIKETTQSYSAGMLGLAAALALAACLTLVVRLQLTRGRIAAVSAG